MRQRSGYLRFANKPLSSQGVGDAMNLHYLDSNGFTQKHVLCLINNAHSALADLSFDSKLAVEQIADTQSC